MPDKQEPVADLVERQHDGERCDDCERRYQIIYRVPDHVWEWIAPKPVEGFKGGGLLCPDCASKRAKNFGIVLRFDATDGWWRDDDTITGKEAEIERLRAERDQWRGSATEFKGLCEEWQSAHAAAQSEATRLRTGIQKLIDGDFAEQSVERVRDRLKALLEEADG